MIDSKKRKTTKETGQDNLREREENKNKKLSANNNNKVIIYSIFSSVRAFLYLKLKILMNNNIK